MGSGAVTLPAATASAAGLMAAADKAAIAGLTARGIYPNALAKSGTIDFNEIIDHGFYFIGGDSPHLNYPETYKQSGGTLQVIRTGNYLTQTFNLVGLNKRFIRNCLNALNDSSERTFSDWSRLLTPADIIVYNHSIDDYSAGYFKLPNGTIVQYGKTTARTGQSSFAIGFSVAFPHALMSITATVKSTAVAQSRQGDPIAVSFASSPTSTTDVQGSLYCIGTQFDMEVEVNWVAIGY